MIGLKRVAIMGCGSGGMTTAVDLGLKGFKVNIFDFPEFDRNLRATSRESPPATMVAAPTALLLYTRAVLIMPTARARLILTPKPHTHIAYVRA